MYARVATFEDSDPAELQIALDAISASDGPPPGVDAHHITVYAGGTGRVIVVAAFETREAMERGHEALSAMSPPAGSMGRLVSADLTEVMLDREPSAP